MNTKYPEIVLELSEIDGNAFSIMGRVTKLMRRAGVSQEECSQYFQEATAGDYDELILTTMRWVSLED